MVESGPPSAQRTAAEDQAWLDATVREAREAISAIHVVAYAQVVRTWEQANGAVSRQWDHWCRTLRSPRLR